MKLRYRINNIGIGDLIFFCLYIIDKHEIGDTVEYCLSSSCIEQYRNNSQSYEKFCKSFISYFLSGFNLKIISESDVNFNWSPDYDYLRNIISKPSLTNYIFNKLSIKSKDNNFKNHIVIFTKVRDLDYDNYKSVSYQFFEYINKLDRQIVLLGEKQLKYEGEYLIHGNTKIYSIYQDCIKYVKQDKLIDMTKSLYDFDDFSLENILKDYSFICNSYQTFIFGGGGFFCLSLFTNRLFSLTNKSYESYFNFQKDKNIFSNIDEFKYLLT